MNQEISFQDYLREEEASETKISETIRLLAARESKSPPHALQAERMMIGAALIDPIRTLENAESAGLRAEDFYDVAHRRIWGAILGLAQRKDQVTTITVADYLLASNQLDAVGGQTSLSRIESSAIGAVATTESNARLLVGKSATRGMMEALSYSLQRCRLGHDADDVADELARHMATVSRTRSTSFADNAAVLRSVIDSLPANGGVTQGISCGFHDVDKLFRMSPGDLIIVAARPSMGKTAWLLDVIRHTAIRRNGACLFFSLEMTAEQVAHRLLAAQSGVEIRKPSFTTQEEIDIAGAQGKIGSANLMIDETPSISIGEIKAKARHAAKRQRIDLIAVDYLQLVTPSNARDNRATEVGEISAGLKAIGRELRCPVVCLSQLNRAVETRNDRRPVMSDLRESGSIEQDADVVAFLYREEYYAREKCPLPKKGVADFIVSKNRNGPVGEVSLRFNAKLPRFDSLSNAAP